MLWMYSLTRITDSITCTFHLEETSYLEIQTLNWETSKQKRYSIKNMHFLNFLFIFLTLTHILRTGYFSLVNTLSALYWDHRCGSRAPCPTCSPGTRSTSRINIFLPWRRPLTGTRCLAASPAVFALSLWAVFHTLEGVSLHHQSWDKVCPIENSGPLFLLSFQRSLYTWL